MVTCARKCTVVIITTSLGASLISRSAPRSVDTLWPPARCCRDRAIRGLTQCPRKHDLAVTWGGVLGDPLVPEAGGCGALWWVCG